MRVLLAHDFYRSSAPSGEDVVYRNEAELLKEHNIEVLSFERFNDDIDELSLAKRIRLARDTAWNVTIYGELSHLLRKTRPDIAHFYNTFPLISPSAYAACQEAGVPVVQTVQNYRLICPGALLLRKGKPCEDCVGSNFLPALRHRCYRGSLPATSALVWMLVSNRSRETYHRLVNRYIAPTQFAAGKLIAGGLPAARMEVKPNFLPIPPRAGMGGGGYVVFAGRLSAEKGVRTLLSAWTRLRDIPLKIVGDGPLRGEMEDIAMQHKLPITFMGFRKREEVIEVVREADFQVVPSEWYEGFPMVIVEAYACGTPVVASRIGSLEEVVEEGMTGVKFQPGNSRDLAQKINMLWNNVTYRTNLRRTARETFEKNFSSEENYAALMAIYEAAVKDRAATTEV